jgi:MFS family permease
VQGAGGGTTGVVQAYVSDSVPPEERAKALGWITAATSAGVAVGAELGSLAARLGPSGPGFVAAGLCALNVVSALRWLPESKRHDQEAHTSPSPRTPLRRSILQVLSHPTSPVSSLIWIYTTGMMAFMAMNGVLALYLGEAYGITEKTSGHLYGFVGVVGIVMRAVLLGPAVRRFGEIGVTRMGAMSLVLGLATIPVPAMLHLARPTQLALLTLAALFIPVGTALLFPATTALVSRRSIKGETGQTMGVQQSFGSVARLVGPVCAGLAFEADIRYPFWAAAALMLATGFLTSRLQEDAPVVEAKEVAFTESSG